MSSNEPINIRDYYNHDTRIALLEKIANDTQQTLQEIRQDIKQTSKELREDIQETRKEFIQEILEIRRESSSNFKWLLSFMISGFAGLFGMLAHHMHIIG